MTRKEILKLAAAVGGAATLLTALGGCAAPTTPTPAAQKLCEPGCVMPAPQSEIGGQKLYFKDSLHGAKTESETKIFNVAEPLTYNPKAATDWVNFFETFATEDKRQFNVKFGQIVTNLQVEPRKPDKRLVIINNPQRADEQFINAIEKAIETTPFGQQEHLLSVLTISPETDLNRDFAYTMCDATLITKEVVKGKVMDAESAFWKQYLCLSFAETYRYRLDDHAYSDFWNINKPGYLETAGDAQWPYAKDPHLPDEHANNLHPYLFDKTIYEQIPNVPVLTRNK